MLFDKIIIQPSKSGFGFDLVVVKGRETKYAVEIEDEKILSCVAVSLFCEHSKIPYIKTAEQLLAKELKK